MAAKLYTMRTALSRVFAEIFQKKFSPHSANNPETRRTFALHCARQKQGYFKLPPFCFCAENDFESDFEIESENDFKFKIGFESDFQSENDCMFHVKHKLNHKSPFMGRKLYYCDSVLSRTFFKKFFGVFAARVSKRKGSPRGA